MSKARLSAVQRILGNPDVPTRGAMADARQVLDARRAAWLADVRAALAAGRRPPPMPTPTEAEQLAADVFGRWLRANGHAAALGNAHGMLARRLSGMAERHDRHAAMLEGTAQDDAARAAADAALREALGPMPPADWEPSDGA